MRVFDQANDACEDGFGAQGQGFDHQTAFAIDRAAGDFIPRLFRHGQAFAADQGLVGVALAFDHFAIHRKTLAGFDEHQVIEAQVADGDVLFLAIDHAQGALRAQGFKGANGAGGLAFGAAFEVFAQQYQRDDHGRGFEVQMRCGAGRGDGPFVQAQAVARAGAEGDQQVHVACACFDGFPGSTIKACAQHKLHRGGEYELCPRGQHPVNPQWHQQHRQNQR